MGLQIGNAVTYALTLGVIVWDYVFVPAATLNGVPEMYIFLAPLVATYIKMWIEYLLKTIYISQNLQYSSEYLYWALLAITIHASGLYFMVFYGIYNFIVALATSVNLNTFEIVEHVLVSILGLVIVVYSGIEIFAYVQDIFIIDYYEEELEG